MTTPLDFWFDFHSPWSYLAAEQIEALAALHGRTVVWRPVHVAKLIAAIDGRRPLEATAAFVRWYRQDLQDFAALAGVTVRYHPDFPLRPARALRAALLAASQGNGGIFARAVFKAYWTESLDISELGVIAAIGDAAGLDGSALAAAAEDPRWKAALEANNVEAQGRGIFGVPTVDADGKLYFGNDRLPLLHYRLGGLAPQQFSEQNIHSTGGMDSI